MKFETEIFKVITHHLNKNFHPEKSDQASLRDLVKSSIFTSFYWNQNKRGSCGPECGLQEPNPFSFSDKKINLLSRGLFFILCPTLRLEVNVRRSRLRISRELPLNVCVVYGITA